MRESHMSLPWHRIECWIGTCFRPAALWEVGVHLSIPHLGQMCPDLLLHIDNTLKLEFDHDQSEDCGPRHGAGSGTDDPGTRPATDKSAMEADQYNVDNLSDDEAAGQEIPDIADYDINEDDDLAGSLYGPGAVPQMDAFKNRFVRVVHLNGIHHLPLISCSCRGEKQVLADLMFSGLLPTTFTQISTLFTIHVLDHIRYSNLDLKASSWQYHRLLRRLTQPLPVHGNMNLYKELRRLSREWRWMKKLKWAGYGHGSFMTIPSIQPNTATPSKEYTLDDPGLHLCQRVPVPRDHAGQMKIPILVQSKKRVMGLCIWVIH